MIGRKFPVVLSVVAGLVLAMAASVGPSAAVVPIPATLTVTGSGSGHGVGLSQYGALGQALSGRSAATILATYYSGTSRMPMADTMNIYAGVGVSSYPALQSMPLATGGGNVALTVQNGGTITGGPSDIWTFRNVSGVISAYKNGILFNFGPYAALRWAGTRDPGVAGAIPTAVRVATAAAGLPNGNFYRYGLIVAMPVAGNLVSIVAVQRLGDEYLNGIAEIPGTWPASAVQAMVIAARSFALSQYRNGVRASCYCHTVAGVDQNFVGYTNYARSTTPGWIAGVSATRDAAQTVGTTVTYQGQLVQAFFFASSGGETQNSQDVWGGTLPWARSVADPWSLLSSTGNSNIAWTRTLSQASLASSFGLPDVVAVTVTSRFVSGYAQTVTATSSTGAISALSGASFQGRFGLPSTDVRSVAVVTTTNPFGAVQQAGIPVPAVPDRGATIEAYAPWDPSEGKYCTIGQTVPATPGALALARLIAATYPTHTAIGISRICSSRTSSHEEGKALDWMLNVNSPADKAVADTFLAWLFATDRYGNQHANARRLGIMYVIWNYHMWRAWDTSRGDYTSVPPHTDHIHISFTWPGARAQTSAFGGSVWTGSWFNGGPLPA